VTQDDVNAKVFICRGAEDQEYNKLLEAFRLGAEFREGRLIVVAEKKVYADPSGTAKPKA
jgi:hypothetical protein